MKNKLLVILTLLFVQSIMVSYNMAKTFTVNSTSDAVDANPGNGVALTAGGLTTLRSAIQEANALAGADTIVIPSGTYTLTLAGTNEDACATGDLDITSSMVITGAGSGLTTIDAAGLDRVFHIINGTVGTVVMSDLRIKGGNTTSDGGGVLAGTVAAVTFNRCIVSNNTANNSGGGISALAALTLNEVRVTTNSSVDDGGGIHLNSSATLVVTKSLIDSNSCGDAGAGIICNATMSLTNVTLSGNTATGFGGAFVLYNGANVTLVNVTIAGNTATNGGGVYRSAGGIVTSVLNSIISGNSITGPLGPDCYGSWTSNGYNIIGNTSGSTGWVASDKQNVNPLLGSLQDNGGLTPTCALQSGSPAIDAATASGAPSVDQRGYTRPQGPGYDIGAYELTVPTTYFSKGSLVVNTPSNWNTMRDGSGTNASSFGTGNTFVIQNSHVMTLTGSSSWDVSASGKVEIESGGSWSNSSSGTVTAGTLQVDNSGLYAHGTSIPLPGSSKSFGATSTVDYNGTSQTVSALTYGNLTLSGSGTKTFSSGTTGIAGSLAVSGSAVTNTVTNSSTIDYNSASNQNVAAIDYYNLTLSNSGTKYFAAGTVGIGGDLNISGTATVDAVTFNDTVKYFGINKTVRYGFINKTVIIDGNTSVTAESDIPVSKTLVISSDATLDMNGYVLTADSVIINDGNFISTNPAGIMSFYSKNSGNYNSLTSWANSGYNGTQTPRLPGVINNDALFIGNSKSVTLTSSVSNLSTIRVESSGTLSTGAYTLSGKGKFDLRAGGTLKIGSADGISSSGSTGNIQTAIRSFSSAANYEYNGTAAQSTGSGLPATLNNLVINNSNGVSLSNSARLTGNLSLTQGQLGLSDKNLTLSTSSSIVGTPSSSNMVVATGSGELRKEFTSIGSFTFPIGDNDGTAEYSPVNMNFTSGSFSSAYAGAGVVNAKHPQNTSTTNYLNRYWTLSSSGISSFLCDITLTYVDADVQPGGSEASIYGGQYSGSWSLLGPVNPTTNQISYSVSSFSDFTGGESSALPVELESFVAKVKENSVELTWRTATEVNNYGFEILRSAQNDRHSEEGIDEESWEKIGFVNGCGNSSSQKNYSFKDNNLKNGIYSYRLKQIDTDGSFSYSNVVNVTVDFTPANFELSQNYPNPFNPSTKIRYAIPSVISSEARNLVTLKIYDILGNEISTLVNEEQSAGVYEVDFDGSRLSSGAYIYKIQTSDFSETKKMILNK